MNNSNNFSISLMMTKMARSLIKIFKLQLAERFIQLRVSILDKKVLCMILVERKLIEMIYQELVKLTVNKTVSTLFVGSQY